MLINSSTLKTILNGLIAKIDSKVGKSELVQPDWNQNDKTALDYIANRPFYEKDGRIYKLDKKYIDLSVYETRLNNKMDSANPVGTGSFSMNRRPETTVGIQSHAEGYYTTASGEQSHAEGSSTTASGDKSHAEGYYTSASGFASHAEGNQNSATSSGAHAEGRNTTASGEQSHAEGMSTCASGKWSHAEGFDSTAQCRSQHVQGEYNILDNESSAARGAYAHIVGNGTSKSARSNAHTLDWSGNATFAGAVTGTGADYAEYFEWLDGNPDDEDRVGKIVALEGEKIRYANPGDEIIGVVSGTAMVLGDNAEWEWRQKYLMDDYGRVITEMVEEFHEEIDAETGEVIKTSLGFSPHRKLNHDYDPEQPYVRRSDRPEWETVGLFGKLHVTDDGTCTVGGYVTAGANGIATASTEKTNMRVMKRINDTIILVLMK